MSYRNLKLCVAGTVFGIMTAGGAMAQAPADIPGLLLWLDASEAGSIISDGGQVAEWRDKSGNNYHATQDNPDRRPVVEMGAIGGKPAVRFDTFGPGDETSDGLYISTELELQRPHSVFIVDKYWGGVTGRTLQGIQQNWLIGKWNGNHGFFAEPWVGNLPAEIEEEAFNVGISTVFSSIWGYNGSIYGGADLQGTPGNLQIGVTDNPPAPPYDEPSQADVAEIIIFDRALGQNERERVEAYLAEKYSIPTRQNRGATRIDVFTGADPGEGLDLSGNIVRALDVGGPGGFTIGDATFTNDAGFVEAENQIDVFYTPTFGPSEDDGKLNTLMQSIRWTNAADGGVRDDLVVTIPGLSAGRVYKVQLLFGDNAPVRRWNVYLEDDLLIGNFGPSAYNRGRPNLGTVLSHRFVATDDTLNIAFSSLGLAGGDINPILQAVILEDEGPSPVFAEQVIVKGRSDLDFAGTFHAAVNAFGEAVGKVGDADFKDEESEANVSIYAERSAPAGGWAATDFGDDPEDDALEAVFHSIRWALTTTTENNLGIVVRGLTPNAEYKIQLLFDEASNPNRAFDISVNGVKVIDDFATGVSFPVVGEGGEVLDQGAQAVVLRLTTLSDTLDITLEGYSAPFADRNPFLGGLTVELVGTNPDSDGDGLPDSWEMEHFGDLAQDGTGDPDNDGSPNLAEYLAQTNPNNADTDGDGLSDGAEAAASTDPRNPDTDGDGLSDGDEVNVHGTNPHSADTDFDTIPDAVEVADGLSNPAKLDSDDDGYGDLAERTAGTDPKNPQSWPRNATVWSNFSGGDLGEGLDLEGNFLYAVNVGSEDPFLDPPAALPQIRGVAFQHDDTVGSVFISATHIAPTWGANGSFGSSGNDVALQQIMQSIRWSQEPDVLDLTIEGLTPGTEYKLQLLFYEACCPNRAYAIWIDGKEVFAEYPPAVRQGPYGTRTGSVVIHHFTATASTLNVLLDGNLIETPGFTDHNPILNAFTLEALGDSEPPPAEEFVIRSVEWVDNKISVRFSSIEGRKYAFDYRESLDTGVWIELADNITGLAGTTEVQIADTVFAEKKTGFFRIRDTALKPDP